MPVEIRLLAYTIVLGLVQVIAAAMAAMRQRSNGLVWAAGSRDQPMPPPTGVAARLDRTSKNFLETFPFFAAAVVAAAALERHNSLVVSGAHCYFWARLAFLPLYAAGVPWVRSVVWGVSVVGILLVVAGVFVRP